MFAGWKVYARSADNRIFEAETDSFGIIPTANHKSAMKFRDRQFSSQVIAAVSEPVQLLVFGCNDSHATFGISRIGLIYWWF